MCIGSRLWSRALLVSLLVTLGTSLELYDQLPARQDLMYQDINDIDTGPGEEPAPRDSPHLNDVMLSKLLKAMRLQAPDNNRSLYRTHSLPYEPDDRHLEQYVPEGMELKDPMYKRLADVFGSHQNQFKNYESRPQQKWKIKKGKALGSQMVCYFKLCAFRSTA